MVKILLFAVVVLVTRAHAGQYATPIFPEDVQESFIGRIVNGYPAINGQFPWQVSILGTRGTQTFVCGGSLISTRESLNTSFKHIENLKELFISVWVLTAGHCVVSVSSFKLGFGSGYRSEPQISVTATQYVLHPNYAASTLNNDVALIRLPSAVPTSCK
jgi:secreted trypsin-like serine protease